jgi:hypothetical protein
MPVVDDDDANIFFTPLSGADLREGEPSVFVLLCSPVPAGGVVQVHFAACTDALLWNWWKGACPVGCVMLFAAPPPPAGLGASLCL